MNSGIWVASDVLYFFWVGMVLRSNNNWVCALVLIGMYFYVWCSCVVGSCLSIFCMFSLCFTPCVYCPFSAWVFFSGFRTSPLASVIHSWGCVLGPAFFAPYLLIWPWLANVKFEYLSMEKFLRRRESRYVAH